MWKELFEQFLASPSTAVAPETAQSAGAMRTSSSLGFVRAMAPTPSWPCLLVPQA